MPGKNGIDDLGRDSIVIPLNTVKNLLFLTQFEKQVRAHLVPDRPRAVGSTPERTRQ
jgi:hypothetical protein